MKHARLVGAGRHVPKRVVTNHDLALMMDTSDEWIRERTGIIERRWVEEGDTAHGMALEATNAALKRAGMSASEIDLIVFACSMPDHGVPGSGCFLQASLGLQGVPAIDVRNACSGFIYGLAIADKFIKTESCKTALVVGSEIQSPLLDKTTRGRDTAIIFGDGAGAAILTAADDAGVLTTHLHADGQFAKKLWSDWPSVHRPPSRAHEYDAEHIYPHMEGKFVFKHAVTRFPEVIREALQATGFSIKDVDLIVPHQANMRIIEAIAHELDVPLEKIFCNIHKYGNTTAASIPIALSEAWDEGKIKEGDLVCLAAFGGGFTWASALVRM